MPEPEIAELANPVNLSSLRYLRDLLARYGLKPQKKFGQNFLLDANILRQIVASAELLPQDNVFEIGPGLGALSRVIAQHLNTQQVVGGTFTCIEKDTRLAPALAETLQGLNIQLVFEDALEFNWQAVPTSSVLVANLPYQISTAILTKLLESGRFKNMVVLVQREVAQRLAAKPGQDNYGFLSAIVSLCAKVERIRDVPASAFFPAPQVVSSVVRIRPTGAQLKPEIVRMIEIVLAHRRKTILNNLRLAGINNAGECLMAAGIDPKIRAEDVPLERIVALAEIATHS